MKFTPDKVPRYLQRLAVSDRDEDEEYDEYEYDDRK